MNTKKPNIMILQLKKDLQPLIIKQESSDSKTKEKKSSKKSKQRRSSIGGENEAIDQVEKQIFIQLKNLNERNEWQTAILY